MPGQETPAAPRGQTAPEGHAATWAAGGERESLHGQSPVPGRAPVPGQPALPGQASTRDWAAHEDQAFPHQALGVVFQVRARRLSVLLWRRAAPPFEGDWALPGGPLRPGERLGTSASRHLADKVDITSIAHLEQLETRSDPARDPRGRVLATAYLALVAAGTEPRIPGDTAWHPVDALPATAFDHGSIIGSARDRLRAKLSYTNIGFALAPESFTIAQVRDIYAASLGHPVSATNLQRILTRRGVITATRDTLRPAAAGGRPATLYRFADRRLVITNAFAAFRPPA